MQNSNSLKNRLAHALIGGLISAVIGAIFWAKFIEWTSIVSGFPAMMIGVLSGFAVLIGGRSRDLKYSFVAAIYAIFGITLGKFLDVAWNSLDRIKAGIIAQNPDIPPVYLDQMAKTIASGDSVLFRMKENFWWGDLVFYFFSAYFAFRIVQYRFLHCWLKFENEGENS